MRMREGPILVIGSIRSWFPEAAAKIELKYFSQTSAKIPQSAVGPLCNKPPSNLMPKIGRIFQRNSWYYLLSILSQGVHFFLSNEGFILHFLPAECLWRNGAVFPLPLPRVPCSRGFFVFLHSRLNPHLELGHLQHLQIWPWHKVTRGSN